MCGRFNLFTNPRLFAEVLAVTRMTGGRATISHYAEGALHSGQRRVEIL
jgi:hypothetical protein